MATCFSKIFVDTAIQSKINLCDFILNFNLKHFSQDLILSVIWICLSESEGKNSLISAKWKDVSGLKSRLSGQVPGNLNKKVSNMVFLTQN